MPTFGTDQCDLCTERCFFWLPREDILFQNVNNNGLKNLKASGELHLRTKYTQPFPVLLFTNANVIFNPFIKYAINICTVQNNMCSRRTGLT